MRVLLAEDDPDLQMLTTLLLEDMGHEVDVASNGSEAVDKAVAAPPDVVLMDLRMPVMDGFTATRKLREHPQTAHVRVVAVSAYVHDKAWCDRAIDAGCSACMPKPLDLQMLMRALNVGASSAR